MVADLPLDTRKPSLAAAYARARGGLCSFSLVSRVSEAISPRYRIAIMDGWDGKDTRFTNPCSSNQQLILRCCGNQVKAERLDSIFFGIRCGGPQGTTAWPKSNQSAFYVSNAIQLSKRHYVTPGRR
ncbi:hypothetical protein COOONC_10098 [Cooperia oncophora]